MRITNPIRAYLEGQLERQQRAEAVAIEEAHRLEEWRRPADLRPVTITPLSPKAFAAAVVGFEGSAMAPWRSRAHPASFKTSHWPVKS